MIADTPGGRSDQTAMRDFLRALERERVGSKPARPNKPPAPPTPVAPRAAPASVAVGDWTLSQDANGDLIATNSQSGTTAVVARKAGS